MLWDEFGNNQLGRTVKERHALATSSTSRPSCGLTRRSPLKAILAERWYILKGDRLSEGDWQSPLLFRWFPHHSEMLGVRALGHPLDDVIEVGGSGGGVVVVQQPQRRIFEAANGFDHAGNGNLEGIVHFARAD